MKLNLIAVFSMLGIGTTSAFYADGAAGMRRALLNAPGFFYRTSSSGFEREFILGGPSISL